MLNQPTHPGAPLCSLSASGGIWLGTGTAGRPRIASLIWLALGATQLGLLVRALWSSPRPFQVLLGVSQCGSWVQKGSILGKEEAAACSLRQSMPTRPRMLLCPHSTGQSQSGFKEKDISPSLDVKSGEHIWYEPSEETIFRD